MILGVIWPYLGIFGHILTLFWLFFHIKRLKTPIGVHFGVHFGVHGVHKHLNSESFPTRPHIPIFHGIFCNPIKPYYAQSVDFECLETYTSHSTRRDLSNETIHDHIPLTFSKTQSRSIKPNQSTFSAPKYYNHILLINSFPTIPNMPTLNVKCQFTWSKPPKNHLPLWRHRADLFRFNNVRIYPNY